MQLLDKLFVLRDVGEQLSEVADFVVHCTLTHIVQDELLPEEDHILLRHLEGLQSLLNFELVLGTLLSFDLIQLLAVDINVLFLQLEFQLHPVRVLHLLLERVGSYLLDDLECLEPMPLPYDELKGFFDYAVDVTLSLFLSSEQVVVVEDLLAVLHRGN